MCGAFGPNATDTGCGKWSCPLTRRRLAANRRNAKKSTGPKDTSKSRFNNLQHGMCSRVPVVLDGEDPVDTILDFAKTRGITQLFIGHSQRSGIWAKMWGNPVEKLIRKSEGMDLRIFPQ